MTTIRDERRAPRGPRGPAFPGPLLMLFPLLILAGGLALLQGRRPAPAEPPAPPDATPATPTPGWLGEAQTPSGSPFAVRLTRLHADDRRQAFETEAMVRRLQLEGEENGSEGPWRLELAFEDGAPEGPEIDLAELAIHDAGGVALAPLSAPEPVEEDSVSDPLAVLIAPPARWRAGRTARLVLWGRRPVEGVELRGGLGVVPLREGAFEPDSVPESLAYLESGPPDEAEATEPDTGEGDR